jgi:hypothetical protein
MRRLVKAGAVAAATAGVAVVVGRTVGKRVIRPQHDRWHSVTINCAPEEVGHLPAPLDQLGEEVEIRVRPAPGDRGTELSARLTRQLPNAIGDPKPVRQLRKALREARQLAEIGEIVRPDSPPTTDRTLTGRPLSAVTAQAKERGRL